MARYLDVHPDNPQPRLLAQIVDALREDQLIAYPTDSTPSSQASSISAA